jgi:prepilin signal peptidase PulO-like enzyme (type II secretory pathway)
MDDSIIHLFIQYRERKQIPSLYSYWFGSGTRVYVSNASPQLISLELIIVAIFHVIIFDWIAPTLLFVIIQMIVSCGIRFYFIYDEEGNNSMETTMTTGNDR